MRDRSVEDRFGGVVQPCAAQRVQSEREVVPEPQAVGAEFLGRPRGEPVGERAQRAVWACCGERPADGLLEGGPGSGCIGEVWCHVLLPPGEAGFRTAAVGGGLPGLRIRGQSVVAQPVDGAEDAVTNVRSEEVNVLPVLEAGKSDEASGELAGRVPEVDQFVDELLGLRQVQIDRGDLPGCECRHRPACLATLEEQRAARGGELGPDVVERSTEHLGPVELECGLGQRPEVVQRGEDAAHGGLPPRVGDLLHHLPGGPRLGQELSEEREVLGPLRTAEHLREWTLDGCDPGDEVPGPVRGAVHLVARDAASEGAPRVVRSEIDSAGRGADVMEPELELVESVPVDGAEELHGDGQHGDGVREGELLRPRRVVGHPGGVPLMERAAVVDELAADALQYLALHPESGLVPLGPEFEGAPERVLDGLGALSVVVQVQHDVPDPGRVEPAPDHL